MRKNFSHLIEEITFGAFWGGFFGALFFLLVMMICGLTLPGIIAVWGFGISGLAFIISALVLSRRRD